MKYLLLISLLMLSTLSPAAALNQEQQKQLQQLDTLLQDNPDLIGDLLMSVERFLFEEQAREQLLLKHQQWLYDNRQHPDFGASNPDLTVLVFTDYNCPYCKRLEPELQRLIKGYPNIKVVNIIVPLRQQVVAGLDTNASGFALSVWQQAPDLFPQVHDYLMEKNGMHDKASLQKIAELTDTVKWLKRHSKSEIIQQKNQQVFLELGLRGTPAILIEDITIPGYVPYTTLEKAVQQVLLKNTP